MSFFAELQRRNVVRVGIAYAVVSWLVLQVADIVFDAIGTPDWVMQTLLLVLAIGLLLALFFAWAYELTPEGIKRENEVDRSHSIASQTGRKLDFAIIGLLAVALAYFIWESRFAPDADGTTDLSTSAVTATEPASGVVESADQAPGRSSIAVLPFDNRSRLAEDEPFVEGVHDDLLTNLARIRSLKVISRTSVTQYRETAKTIPEIAAELGVATVMEGAVQRSGDTIRINVQLIDAQTDEHLWAEIYDRQLTAENLFAIQSEISEAIAHALEATLSDAEQDRISTMPTDNLAAYDAYVRGRQLLVTRESDDIEAAAAEFREAVNLDPEFTLAWVGLVDSYALWREYGVIDRDESIEVREEALAKALALDDQLGEVWASKARLLHEQRSYEEAEENFRRAIDLSPGYATAYHWYSILLGRYELRTDERVALAEKAKALNPRSPIIGINLSGAYRDQGRYLRAERELIKVLDLAPDYTYAMAQLAYLYRDMGRIAEAMRYVRRAAAQDPGNPDYVADQVFYYLLLDNIDEAERTLEQLDEAYPDRLGNGFLRLFINMAKGNLAGAFEVAEWLVPKVEAEGGGVGFMAMLNMRKGDFVAARKWELRNEPRWEDPGEWRRLIEERNGQACVVAWLLIQTGDPEQGERLLTEALSYLTEELPEADEHADRHATELCHLAAGDTDAALTVLETQLDHNHIDGQWRMWLEGPIFAPLEGDERFEKLLAENDRRIAAEREKLAALDQEQSL